MNPSGATSLSLWLWYKWTLNYFDVILARMLLEQDHVIECLDVLCSVCNMTSEHDVTAQVHALVGACFSRQVETLACNIRSLQWAATESFHDIYFISSISGFSKTNCKIFTDILNLNLLCETGISPRCMAHKTIQSLCKPAAISVT